MAILLFSLKNGSCIRFSELILSKLRSFGCTFGGVPCRFVSTKESTSNNGGRTPFKRKQQLPKVLKLLQEIREKSRDKLVKDRSHQSRGQSGDDYDQETAELDNESDSVYFDDPSASDQQFNKREKQKAKAMYIRLKERAKERERQLELERMREKEHLIKLQLKGQTKKLKSEEKPINEEIRPDDRGMINVLDEEGKLHETPLDVAISNAQSQGMVVMQFSPPNAPKIVCRILNLGRYKFNLAKQKKKANANKNKSPKLIRMPTRIAPHDEATKVRQICKLLDEGHPVTIVAIDKVRSVADDKLAEILRSHDFYKHASVSASSSKLGFLTFNPLHSKGRIQMESDIKKFGADVAKEKWLTAVSKALEASKGSVHDRLLTLDESPSHDSENTLTLDALKKAVTSSTSPSKRSSIRKTSDVVDDALSSA